MPEISVIIVNWNGRHFLHDCLTALSRQTFRDFETIFVDNGSTDGSVEYVRIRFPGVKILALPENRGFTGGNICGCREATGNLITLLNNDTQADPAWLQEIFKASHRYPAAGSFASKMMYFDRRDHIENCGFDVGIAGTTVDLGRDEPDGPLWSQSREVFGACGGAGVYRRTMLEQIGFLDPDFFMIYEDVDLSFRAQLRGYSCLYVPTAIIYHRYRSTLSTIPARQVFYSQRNIEFLYLKNMPFWLIVRGAPQRLLYELGAALHFMRLGAGLAFFRAKLDAIKHLPLLLRKRKLIQKQKTVDDSRLLASMKGSLRSKWVKLGRSLNKPFDGRLHLKKASETSTNDVTMRTEGENLNA